MKFYDQLVKSSPFFMRELALTFAKDKTNMAEIDKIYKKIYMQIRYYHKIEWKCDKIDKGNRGRRPLKCTYVGVR